MPLNASHRHTDLMKISKFVPSFSTPTPVLNNRRQRGPLLLHPVAHLVRHLLNLRRLLGHINRFRSRAM
jgi:hypothetical protein